MLSSIIGSKIPNHQKSKTISSPIGINPLSGFFSLSLNLLHGLSLQSPLLLLLFFLCSHILKSFDLQYHLSAVAFERSLSTHHLKLDQTKHLIQINPHLLLSHQDLISVRHLSFPSIMKYLKSSISPSNATNPFLPHLLSLFLFTFLYPSPTSTTFFFRFPKAISARSLLLLSILAFSLTSSSCKQIASLY